MQRWLVRVWAAPWSVLGLVLAVGFRHRCRTRGILLCWGAEWPARLGWRYRAITFGHVVLAVDELDERILSHELVHVRQYERWGPFMGPAYLWASVAARLRGGRGYADNSFEVAARAGEKDGSSGGGGRAGGASSGPRRREGP